MTTIKDNSRVSLYYRLSLDDGTEVESNHGDDTLDLTLGDGTLTRGMEAALMDRSEGDSVEVTLEPEQGYGYPDEENVHTIALGDFPADLRPEVGQVIAFDGPDDEDIIGTIVAIEGDDVGVDFSHPLAGRTLVFRADIVKVSETE